MKNRRQRNRGGEVTVNFLPQNVPNGGTVRLEKALP